MNNEPKISIVEAFLLISYIGLTDAVGLILVLFGLDDFFILDIMTFPVTQLYFRMKGISKAGYDVAANLAELVPYIGALPIRTFGVLTVIWIDRHPEGAIAQTVEKTAEKIPVKGGGTTKIAPAGVAIKTPVGGLAQK